jgi:hypothetical protein
MNTSTSTGLLIRVAEQSDRATINFFLDGQVCTALAGDTVLTAVLIHGTRLRRSEFSGGSRAGFCLMGACQDCWISTEEGLRLRACDTFIGEGMRLFTGATT